ncbi:MAG: carbon-nitrogen hydrolase family protein [Proteobacteria bacterium]|nr:carbon-nitrogen hydrolase family protein [Pseudomonadota bacterium]MBU1742253.1 carbon-nitrogen hydrolase family protein [Pseudomonadota bacterium]
MSDDKSLTLALIQMRVESDPAANRAKAENFLRRAREHGADLAVLPEMFVCPYDQARFPEFAEPLPDGPTGRMLSSLSRELGMAVVGGSLPEQDAAGRVFNTSPVFDTQGRLIAAHRKVHLFDVDLPGMRFFESTTLSAGEELTVFDLSGWRIGLGVCYDVRFPEPWRLMALGGAELMVVPGAFNPVTGPAHWDLVLRARAVENTVYVAGVSPAPTPGASYQAWGHSKLVDPFGEIVASLERQEGLVLGSLDRTRLRAVRKRLPVLDQRRTDLYSIRWSKE